MQLKVSLFITIIFIALLFTFCVKVSRKGIIKENFITNIMKKIDYEIIMYTTIVLICVSICLHILFNNLFIDCVISLVGLPLIIRKVICFIKKKRNKFLEMQFCEVLQIMASFLVAGRNPKLIFNDIVNEFEGNNQYVLIIKEFRKINRQLSINFTIEEALEAFAVRSQNKDVQSFTRAYSICLLSGGNLVELVRNSALVLRIKLETENEIKLLLTLPRFNHKILTIMPFFILGLLRITSPEYIKPLYTSSIGSITMFIVASLLISAWFLGDKISNIKL